MTPQPDSRALRAGVGGCLAFAAVSLALPDGERWREQATLQTGQELDGGQVASVASFLPSLRGEIPAAVRERLERLGAQ
jgi:hypothetical protein